MIEERHPVLLPLREKVARAAGRMRGLAEVSRLGVRSRLSGLRDPSSDRLRRPPSPARGEGWSGLIALAAWLAPALAFAHEGDHAAMTVTQVAHHIATSPDHLAELVIAALFAVGGGVRQARRARVRVRK